MLTDLMPAAECPDTENPPFEAHLDAPRMHAVNNGFCDLEASLAQSSDHSELGHNDLHCLPNKMCLWDCLKHKKTPSPAPTTTPGACPSIPATMRLSACWLMYCAHEHMLKRLHAQRVCFDCCLITLRSSTCCI